MIARLRNQQYTTRDSIIKPEKFGIDHIIHPEREACKEIVKLVHHSYATQVKEFEGGRMQTIGIRLDKSFQLWVKLYEKYVMRIEISVLE